MGEYRSKSYADGRNTQYPQGHYLEKSYSYAGPRPDPLENPVQADPWGPNELTKNTSKNSNNNWILSDPEMKRKQRVASYKAYTVEGKVKGGFKKGFRWIKDRYNLVLHGWRS